MFILFEYIIKISLSLGVVWLFYFLLLKPLTYYICNRFFLVTSSILVFFIPLLSLDFFVAPQKINASAVINSIPSINVHEAGKIFSLEDSSGNMAYVLLALLVSGVIIRSMHFFIQFRSFKKIRSKALLIEETEGIKLYHLNTDIIPFSFNNSIYINKLHHTADDLAEIIRHESVHVRQKHTIDVLIAEFICIINWYNPFAWLIKHAIKQNLEFLADDILIQNGTDKKRYQYLLLKVMGHSPLTISNSLNFSSLKNRIFMMNKTKSSKRHLLKFLFVLPVIVLMMLAFRSNDSVANGNHVSTKEESFRLSELTYSIPDPAVTMIIKREQAKSLLRVGKPFTITLIRNERDRLKMLLEKNGYHNITNHSISFLIDSSLTNNSFSVQVNIDLQTKTPSVRNNNGTQSKKSNAVMNGNNNTLYQFASLYTAGFSAPMQSYLFAWPSFHANNVNTQNLSII
ncbi:MAG TPA: M56 family metallopeptidase [Chitinophagaceae bacterium]